MLNNDTHAQHYINITFPARVIVENIIPRNVIINRGAAEVDYHILRDDFFDYHPSRKCNIYFIIPKRTLGPYFQMSFYHGEGRSKWKIMNSLLSICLNEIKSYTKMVLF